MIRKSLHLAIHLGFAQMSGLKRLRLSTLETLKLFDLMPEFWRVDP